MKFKSEQGLKTEKPRDGHEDAEGAERFEREYWDGVKKYDRLYREIKELEKKVPEDARDEEIAAQIIFIDRERDDLHKELIAGGQLIGKSEHEVLTDLLRQRGTLEEYRLPEFIILDGDEVDVPRAKFGIGADERPTPVPEPGTQQYQLRKEMEENLRQWEAEIKAGGGEDSGGDFVAERMRLRNSAVIVYEALPLFHTDESGMEQGGWALYAPDSMLRNERAQALAKTLSLDFIKKDDEGWHAAEVQIRGVAVPKERLVKVAAFIREHPEYRIGEQFYSAAEKERGNKEFAAAMRKMKGHMTPDERRLYEEAWEKFHGKKEK